MIFEGCARLKFLGVMCAGDRAILAVTVNTVGASGAAPGQAAAAVANHPGASTNVAQNPQAWSMCSTPEASCVEQSECRAACIGAAM